MVQTKTIGEDSFSIGKSMIIHKPWPVWKRVLASIVGLCVSPIILFIVIPVFYLYMGNKSRSARVAGKFLSGLMKQSDKAFRHIKTEITKSVRGNVLDFGSGGGGWLPYLHSKGNYKVSRVTALEPNEHMHPHLREVIENEQKLHPDTNYEIYGGFAHELKGKEMFDTIIFGNVFCEVPHPAETLKEIDRLLKPGGTIRFLEHVRDPEGSFAAWCQDKFNFIWNRLTDGCNCNRTTLQAIESVKGWKVISWDMSVEAAPPPARRQIFGVVLKEGGEKGKQKSDL